MRANNGPEQDRLGTRDHPDSSDFLTKNRLGGVSGDAVGGDKHENKRGGAGGEGRQEYVTSRTRKEASLFCLI